MVVSGTAMSKTSTISLPTEGEDTTTPTRMGRTIIMARTTRMRQMAAVLDTNRAVKGATGVEEGGRTSTGVAVLIIGAEEVRSSCALNFTTAGPCRACLRASGLRKMQTLLLFQVHICYISLQHSQNGSS